MANHVFPLLLLKMCSNLYNSFSCVFGLRSTLEVGISLGIRTLVSLNLKVGQTVQTIYLPLACQGANGLVALYDYQLLPASAELYQCTVPIGLLA